VERLVTKGKHAIVKKQKLAAARNMARFIPVPSAIRKVLEVLAPRYADRNGGYTRILKLSSRAGDAARMARIEFV
jgi:large subunit ribosomal protein L17